MNPSDRSDPQQRRTVVEHGTEFQGKLSSTCPIDVHGRIEGQIETPALTVSASGAVHGSVKVGSVSSEGELSGEFDAERVELAGRVRDNTVIRTRSLHVKLAAERGKLQVIFGECELSVGDEPAERATVDEQSVSSLPSLDVIPQPVVEDTLPSAAQDLALVDPNADLPVTAPDAEDGGHAGKRQRKGKASNGEAVLQGWSQPPSQPPPAS